MYLWQWICFLSDTILPLSRLESDTLSRCFLSRHSKDQVAKHLLEYTFGLTHIIWRGCSTEDQTPDLCFDESSNTIIITLSQLLHFSCLGDNQFNFLLYKMTGRCVWDRKDSNFFLRQWNVLKLTVVMVTQLSILKTIHEIIYLKWVKTISVKLSKKKKSMASGAVRIWALPRSGSQAVTASRSPPSPSPGGVPNGWIFN